jgi:uncharacterized membrane protein
MAVLAHALQMVGGFIAPLVILIVKRSSRFVSFHALQALLLQAAYFVVMMFFMVIWFALIFSQVLSHAGQQSPNLPFAFFMVFPLFWLFMMGFWIVNLLAAILFSIKAGRGEWAEYPVLGGLARKMLGIGPGGMVTSA